MLALLCCAFVCLVLAVRVDGDAPDAGVIVDAWSPAAPTRDNYDDVYASASAARRARLNRVARRS